MVNIAKLSTMAVLVLILFCMPVASQTRNATQLVTVYTYHLKPPYIIDLESETGLYFDFVDYINKNISDVQLHLTYLPRKRLVIYLQRKQLNGIVVGVNPAWFNDRLKEKYFWTSKIFADRDEVVSKVGNPVEYRGPESLHGKTIGGVLGYYYFGISEAVESGKVKKEDANSEKALLEMIYHNRVSAGIVSIATYNYLVVKHGWQGRFLLSEEPHDKYTRHVLAPLYMKKIYETIYPIIEKMTKDPEWQNVLDRYKINFDVQ